MAISSWGRPNSSFLVGLGRTWLRSVGTIVPKTCTPKTLVFSGVRERSFSLTFALPTVHEVASSGGDES